MCWLINKTYLHCNKICKNNGITIKQLIWHIRPFITLKDVSSYEFLCLYIQISLNNTQYQTHCTSRKDISRYFQFHIFCLPRRWLIIVIQYFLTALRHVPLNTKSCSSQRNSLVATWTHSSPGFHGWMNHTGGSG